MRAGGVAKLALWLPGITMNPPEPCGWSTSGKLLARVGVWVWVGRRGCGWVCEGEGGGEGAGSSLTGLISTPFRLSERAGETKHAKYTATTHTQKTKHEEISNYNDQKRITIRYNTPGGKQVVQHLFFIFLPDITHLAASRLLNILPCAYVYAKYGVYCPSALIVPPAHKQAHNQAHKQAHARARAHTHTHTHQPRHRSNH
jgi:hypothetical protein